MRHVWAKIKKVSTLGMVGFHQEIDMSMEYEGYGSRECDPYALATCLTLLVPSRTGGLCGRQGANRLIPAKTLVYSTKTNK